MSLQIGYCAATNNNKDIEQTMIKQRQKLVLLECKRGCGRKFNAMQRTRWEMHEEVRKKFHGICASCLTDKEREELLNALWEKS